MKMLITETGYHRVTRYISDDAKADVAYAKLKAALANYREYGNGEEKSVSVELDTGELTIRLDGALGGFTAVEIHCLNEAQANAVHEINAWSAQFEKRAPEKAQSV